MLQRSSSLRLKKVLQSVLAAAALGITAGAANAQYGSLPRLGGPLIVADYSGYGYNGGYGYSSPYAGSAFGSNGYTNGSTAMGLDNLPRNIAFDGTGTFGFGIAANNTAAGANQLINDPLLGFQQPRQVVIPTASGYVDANGNPVSLANVISGLNNGSAFVGNTGLTGNTTLNDASTAGVNTAAGFNNSVVIMPSSTLGRINTNTGVINRMPTDGTIVPQAVNGNVNGFISTPINNFNSNVGAINRMPTDGTIVPQASSTFVNGGFPAAFSYGAQQVFGSNSLGRINNGFNNSTLTNGNGFISRMPSNGTIVPQGSFGIQSSLRASAVRTR